MIFLYKALFVLLFAYLGTRIPPFPGATPVSGGLLGGGVALFLAILAINIRQMELKTLWSATLGLVLGGLIGWLCSLSLDLVAQTVFTHAFYKAVFLLAFPLTGLFVGLQKPNMFSPFSIREFFRGSSISQDSFLLDTSAIIDGRVVGIAQTGFIRGELIITQFVLAELQMIADSSDPSKKIRGRRGLDMIDQLKQNHDLSVTIINKPVTGVREVDQKLILLAREMNCRIVTNDINLSRIAQLQDVPVLNVNELAFALKPAVLPGETMNLTITREGKEKRQGIAYLEDGTMVVVDDARGDVGKTMAVEVTSVLQTSSG